MSRDFYLRNRRTSKIKAHRQSLDFGSAMEQLFYELKPLAYLVFATSVLRTDISSIMWIKFAAVGILAFAIYIALGRLVHRGIL